VDELLRCTLAGLIPLMMSEKYSSFSEEFYRSQKSDFDKILIHKDYFLIRDLPVDIAARILLPELAGILSKQKSNGLWGGSTKVTYDVLSALKHIGVIEDPVGTGKMQENLHDHLIGKYDYHSLLIKSEIYHRMEERDILEINKIIKEMKGAQRENGSWEETIVATVHHIEKLLSLGVLVDDDSINNGIAFLFEHLNVDMAGQQGSGKTYGLQGHFIFSTEDRSLEFNAAERYEKALDPKLICYRHLGIMQNSLCLKLLVRVGLEHDERVGSALDGIYSIFECYHSLCYFRIQKEFAGRQRKDRTGSC
jgi:hypothetical protein